MEKKLQPKSAADARRPDVCNSKPWLRPKKRESPVNVPTKSENNRKQNAPRGKSFDKRPRPRSSYHGCAVGGKEDSRLDESGAEVGSVFLPGSKKQNLNHLLNFHYAPRDANRQGSNRGNRKPHGLIYTNTHKHNKELFLQSNCQFVVKSDGDYTPYLFDPDLPICWDFIEQINVRVNEPLSCPICLGETVAGRITRCGHTYCWPCLLRYFSLAEESSRPCPICFQPIDKKNLKSVQGVWHNYVPVGEDITMKLMRRLRGSTLVELAPSLDPVDNILERSNNLLSISENEPSSIFSKLLTASPHEVIDIIMRERRELNSQLSEDLEYPEFVLEALHLLQNREDSMISKVSSVNDTSNAISIASPKVVEVEDNACDSSDIFIFDDNVSKRSLSESDNIENSNSTQSNVPSSANVDNSAPEKPNSTEKYFYFYQASDGQAIFLHGLDIRIIEASWGSLDLAPREIHGVILERASGSVGAECRRRLRCLQHLPIHCPYDFVEIHLKPPTVTYDALKEYKVELDDRKRLRQKRAREEKRRERVISQKEQVLMGRIPTLEININSEEHFPAYQPGLELTPPSTDWKWNDAASVDSTSPGPSSLSKSENSMSFAKMASTEGIWKVRQSHASPSTSANVRNDQDDSDDDNLAPPDYHISLSEAITAALQKSSLNTHEESPNKDGKKRKKHKAKVLFTTGIQHRTAID